MGITLTRTPLRISLFGGGTDFPNYIEQAIYGKVLSFAIDKYVYITVKDRHDTKWRVSYNQNELVEKYTDLKHDIAKACIMYTEDDALSDLYTESNGLEIHSLSDVSASGTGLGSSSAYTVGLLNALLHKHRDLNHIAKSACRVEIDYLKKPIGVQDQWACALGGCNTITMYKNYDVNVIRHNDVYNSFIHTNILLFYTGESRTADPILKEQSEKININKPYLDELKTYVEMAQYYIENRNVKEFGKLLNKSWLLKKSFSSGITNDKVDNILDLVLSNGAYGAKLGGAGGSGFITCVVPYENQHTLRHKMAVEGYSELKFNIDTEGSKVLYND